MSSRRLRGFTLVEMVVAIVIISVGLAGVLLAFGVGVRASADPLIQKQMLAIGEEMMEEILLKPHAATGTAPTNTSTGCGVAAARAAFDDVADYHNYQTTGICDIDGAAVPGLEGYGVKVSVTAGSWQGVAGTLTVQVTVSHGTDTLSLKGWRTGYAS